MARRKKPSVRRAPSRPVLLGADDRPDDRPGAPAAHAARRHPLQWVLEPVETQPSFFQKPMFGCQAVYLHGRLMLVLAAGEEPWNGLLVCTSREFHAALIGAWPCLEPHPVLGKWLYLAQYQESFEETARELVLRIGRNDPRIGVEPKHR